MAMQELTKCMKCQVGAERFLPVLCVIGANKDLYKYRCPHCENESKVSASKITAIDYWNQLQNKIVEDIIYFHSNFD